MKAIRGAQYRLIYADSLEIMRKMRDNSVDTVITDPPYALQFMQKHWDYELPSVEVFLEILRVSKPGATLLCFGGTRTFHRLACNIEDAGWHIRDTLMWMYGQGFPKSHNVANSIDKRHGASDRGHRIARANRYHPDGTREPDGESLPAYKSRTPYSGGWDGYGTALKPAWEPILLCMKPLEGTFAENALKWGVAGLNIDAGRIGFQSDADKEAAKSFNSLRKGKPVYDVEKGWNQNKVIGDEYVPKAGRWPANVLLEHHPECKLVGCEKIEKGKKDRSSFNNPSENKCMAGANLGHKSMHYGEETIEKWECHPECPIRLLDEQTINQRASRPRGGKTVHRTFKNCMFKVGKETIVNGEQFNDKGGASRFFYCSKASTKERGKYNTHPTVKPLKLMEYLCKLTRTPTGGLVLDPFVGSGTTILACLNTGRKCIGIDNDKDTVHIAYKRIKEWEVINDKKM